MVVFGFAVFTPVKPQKGNRNNTADCSCNQSFDHHIGQWFVHPKKVEYQSNTLREQDKNEGLQQV